MAGPGETVRMRSRNWAFLVSVVFGINSNTESLNISLNEMVRQLATSLATDYHSLLFANFCFLVFRSNPTDDFTIILRFPFLVTSNCKSFFSFQIFLILLPDFSNLCHFMTPQKTISILHRMSLRQLPTPINLWRQSPWRHLPLLDLHPQILLCSSSCLLPFAFPHRHSPK